MPPVRRRAPLYSLYAAETISLSEYRLFVYPTLVGRGRRLFESEAVRPDLNLVQARPFRSGLVLMTYRSAA